MAYLGGERFALVFVVLQNRAGWPVSNRVSWRCAPIRYVSKMDHMVNLRTNLKWLLDSWLLCVYNVQTTVNLRLSGGQVRMSEWDSVHERGWSVKW